MTPSGENEAGGGLTLSSMVKEIQGLKDKFKRDDADSRALAVIDPRVGDALPRSFAVRRFGEGHGTSRVSSFF